MTKRSSCNTRSSLIVICVATVVGVACQTPQTPPTPTAPTAESTDKRTTPPPPTAPREPPSHEDKAQAQKLGIDALDKLQAGDEASARATLEQALQLDPGNELARKLMDQIKADAQEELGVMSFKYTVQPEDTLSKLAQRFLGDRYRFYILAKYNDLRVPNRLSVGQVIRIPGQEPKAPAAVKAAPKPAETRAKPPEPAAKPEAAVIAPAPAAQADTQKARQASIQRYSREAEACQRKQNLDCAIQKWGQVLELDPDNQQAKLKRDKAMTLNEQLKTIK